MPPLAGPRLPTVVGRVEVRGLNTIIGDLIAIGQVTVDLIQQANDLTGQIVEYSAKDMVPIRTGDTYRSINYETWSNASDMHGVDIGPTTFYAPYVEWGTAKTRPHPFMIPAATLNEAAYLAVMAEIAAVAAGNRTISNPYERAQDPITRWRTLLYSTEKAMGDLSVFGFRPILSGPRSIILGVARGLGDVSAVMSGAIGARITERITGVFTGSLIGVGRVRLQASQTYSGFVGGGVAHRLYQRTAGKYARIATGL